MSLNLSRRSFFRFIATVLVTVACAGMLAGCGSDSNKPSRNGDGAITNIQVKADVTQNTTTQRSYKFEITNNRSNDIWVDEANFWYSVKDSDGYTKVYNDLTFSEISSSKKKTTYDSLPVRNIAKGDDVTLTVTIPDSTTLAKGYKVTIYYAPDTTYKEMNSSWVYTIKG